MAAPDVVQAEAVLDGARETATIARAAARAADETLAEAIVGYNQALRQENS